MGALLVTTAAVVAFAASNAGRDAPGDPVVVARRPVAPGDVLSGDDLGEERATLPPAVRDRTFARPDEVEGAVALGPIGSGEPLLRSAVARAGPLDPPGPSFELSLPVERARALDGRLVPGDLVDVLVTHGTDRAAVTEVVARRARVLDSDESSDGLGGDVTTLRLSLASPTEVMAAAHAGATGSVTVVRATRAADERGPDRYEAPDAARSPR